MQGSECTLGLDLSVAVEVAAVVRLGPVLGLCQQRIRIVTADKEAKCQVFST